MDDAKESDQCRAILSVLAPSILFAGIQLQVHSLYECPVSGSNHFSNPQSNHGHCQELVPNRVPYLDRGWCIGETNWTSMRNSPKRIPDTKDGYCRAPMSPEVFEQRQEKFAWPMAQKLQST